MVFQVYHDGNLEFGDALEGAAPDAVSGDLGKNRSAIYRRGLVSGIVVNDEIEIQTSRGLPVDQFEKVPELAMWMTRHASPDNLAVEHVSAANRVVVPLRL